MTNVEMLNDKIDKSGFKRTYIAEKVNITPQGLSNKLNGMREFTVGEMFRISDVLSLTDEEKIQIFFYKES